MGLGLADIFATAIRRDGHRPAVVSVEHANYGITGGIPAWRGRSTATIVAPPDPRLRPYNTLIPIVYRLRVLDTAKMAALNARAPNVLGAPVTFTPPRTARLSGGLGSGGGG